MSMRISRVLAACAALTLVLGCSSGPQIRVRNERPTKANVQVQPQSGSTLNINEVQPGSTTAYVDLEAGTTYRVKAALQGETSPADVQFRAQDGLSYTAVVYGGSTPALRVDSE
ncbi:MAG: hypothetical protein HZB25_09285 [Candidatus Eisenbacteria bacterium]|nr:hypothetical protein [Candidatus Eisenbacteria bacterium]